jgi:hypothetical protein
VPGLRAAADGDHADRIGMYRYRAGEAIRCHHCTASALGAEPYRDSPQPNALLIPVTYVPPEEAAP